MDIDIEGKGREKKERKYSGALRNGF